MEWQHEKYLLDRYPDEHAVFTRTDGELVADFRVGLKLPNYKPAGGAVTGWISREITRRGIRP
jgi:hypothetical protein